MPARKPSSATRRLRTLSVTAFAAALLGLLVLFNPTLEFYAIDLLEKLHLSLAVFGNIALLAEALLLLSSVTGLVLLTIHRLRQPRNPRKPSDPPGHT